MMKKIRPAAPIICLLTLVALAATGCAQTGSGSMSGSGLDTKMETMSGDSMDYNMDKSMNTMNEEKMDSGMEKNMQHEMK